MSQADLGFLQPLFELATALTDDVMARALLEYGRLAAAARADDM